MIPDQLADQVMAAISAAQEAGELPAFESLSALDIVVDRSKQSGHGDFATPVAMQLAKASKLPPRTVAEKISAHLPVGEGAMVARVEIAGPGFINFHLATSWLLSQIETVLHDGAAYADLTLGSGQSAMVEFVSVNPTGPLTVGHGRGAVIGDILGNILTAGGYKVTREYYFNDGGLQMTILAESVRVRARQLRGEQIEFPENHYVGEYIKTIAEDLLASDGPGVVDQDWTYLRDKAIEVIFAEIRETLHRLGVTFDTYINERSFYEEDRAGNVWDIVKGLRACDLAYDADGAVWFRATNFGSDKDRVLVRSSGEPTYRLPDIAYHANKLQRGFDLVVNVFGADHIAQYPDIAAAVNALGYDSSKIRIVTNQFVTLLRDGEIVKMSTRRATFVTLDELIDEVGVDAVRYFMISRSPDSQFEFNLNLATAQNDENPVYYIQYAHARTAGILDRRAPSEGIAYNPDADLTLLQHPSELALVHQILRLKETLRTSIVRLEPHQIASYATELATRFSAFYRDCHVLRPEDLALSQARLKLVRATRIALERALTLLGISAPDSM